MRALLLTFLILQHFQAQNLFSQDLSIADFKDLSSLSDTASIDYTVSKFKPIYKKHHTHKHFDSLLLLVIKNSEKRVNMAVAIGGYALNPFWDSTNFDDLNLSKKILDAGIQFQANVMKSKADSDTKFMAKGDKCVLELCMGINLYLRNQKDAAAIYFKSAKKLEFWDMCFPAMEQEKARAEIIGFIEKL
ncbi:MAG TPA: hypothetical protein VGF79_08125 [Bacteroidia bacterium]